MIPTQPPSTKPCAIDALRLYIAPEELRPEFIELQEEIRKESSRVEDYRAHNLPFVMVCPKKGYRRDSPLILDFQGVGRLSARDILGTLSRVAVRDPVNVRVGAVDFTADWIGGSVALCRRSVNVRAKRNRSIYVNPNRAGGDYQTMRHDSGTTETLYFGSQKSGDFYRLYDKAAHLRKCGEVDVPDPWTRVERHLSGRALPERLRTVGGLLHHGRTFSPFLNLEISPHSEIGFSDFLLWQGADVTANMRRNAFWVNTLICEVGRAEAKRLLRKDGRQVKQDLNLLDRALHDIGASIPELPDFNSLYKAAFRHQIWPDCVAPKSQPNGDSYNNRETCSELLQTRAYA